MCADICDGAGPMLLARHAQAAAAHRPAADQQVLCVRSRAGEKHCSVLPQGQPAGVCHQIISWKNPTPAERRFGIDTYVAALEEAVDAMRDITGSEDVNIWGSCSGGITMSVFLAHLAARGERKIHSATVAVCLSGFVPTISPSEDFACHARPIHRSDQVETSTVL
jgi:hypothetical protein